MCVLIQFTLPFSEKFSVINTKICSLSVEDIKVFLVVLYERSNKLQPIESVAIVVGHCFKENFPEHVYVAKYNKCL